MHQFSRALALSCLLLTPASTLAQDVKPREPLLQQALRLSPLLKSPQTFEQRSGNELSQRQTKRTPAKRIFGAIVGGVGGFFAGGYTGAWIEGGRCHCDDPGLKGALIGAPTGAAAGAILGGLYLF